GGSNGTRLALAYLRRHPEHVRAAVLDGVVPPDFPAPIGYARSAQQSLDRVFQDCDAQPDCRAAFPSLRTEFTSLHDRFHSGAAAAKVRRPDSADAMVKMTWEDFGYAVRGILYNAGAIRQLPLMIHRAASAGDLSEFAQRYYDRAAGFEQSFADGLHLAVFCAEDVPFIRDEEVAPATAGTFLGSYLVDQYRAACRLWERAEVAPDIHQPIRAQVPVLLYSGHYDPVTPSATGEAVARALPQSRHIVVRDQAHGQEFGSAISATGIYLLEL